MQVERTAEDSFTATFESEQELREECATNLTFGALRLPFGESLPREMQLQLTLRGPWGGTAEVTARVAAPLPDGIALALDGDPDAIVARLLERAMPAPAEEDDEPPQKSQTTWDRVRGLSQTEKILLAPKADRTERALLIQDNDPRVLLSILRNPRITTDEIVRLAKSSFLTYQIADVIMQTGQWMGNLEVRVALIHNPKTPQAFGLRILPTLPDSEVRTIARSGTSMALKQAALRRLQQKA